MIYFAQAEGTELVKIGFTAGDPAKRVRELQTGCPHRLVIIATVEGVEQDEARWHKQFSDDRQQGEWFKMSWRLCLAIARAEAGAIVTESFHIREALTEFGVPMRPLFQAAPPPVSSPPPAPPRSPRLPHWWEAFITEAIRSFPLLSRQLMFASFAVRHCENSTVVIKFPVGRADAAAACGAEGCRHRILSLLEKQFGEPHYLVIEQEELSFSEVF